MSRYNLFGCLGGITDENKFTRELWTWASGPVMRAALKQHDIPRPAPRWGTSQRDAQERVRSLVANLSMFRCADAVSSTEVEELNAWYGRLGACDRKDPPYPFIPLAGNHARMEKMHPTKVLMEEVAGTDIRQGVTQVPFFSNHDQEAYRTLLLAELPESKHQLLNSMTHQQREWVEQLLAVSSITTAYANKAYAAWALMMREMLYQKCCASLYQKCEPIEPGQLVAPRREDHPTMIIPEVPPSPWSVLKAHGVQFQGYNLGVVPHMISRMDWTPQELVDTLTDKVPQFNQQVMTAHKATSDLYQVKPCYFDEVMAAVAAEEEGSPQPSARRVASVVVAPAATRSQAPAASSSQAPASKRRRTHDESENV